MSRRILNALQRNGSLSSAELSEHVNASPSSCWRRIKSMQEAGIIGQSVVVLDPHSVGLKLMVLCSVRLRSHEPALTEQFLDFVSSTDAILDCFSTSGDWDYMLRIVAQNVEQYENLLMRNILKQPSVATAMSHFVLRKVKQTTVLPL